MKIKIMDLWMKTEGRKLIFIMNFSVLHFFKFASRMPQIAQILVLTQNILGKHAPGPPRIFLFASTAELSHPSEPQSRDLACWHASEREALLTFSFA